MSINDFPAFPFEYEGDGGQRVNHAGMTLRDYFAGQALASIPIRSWDDIGSGDALIAAWAKCAYAVADAMLAARSPQANVAQDGTADVGGAGPT